MSPETGDAKPGMLIFWTRADQHLLNGAIPKLTRISSFCIRYGSRGYMPVIRDSTSRVKDIKQGNVHSLPRISLDWKLRWQFHHGGVWNAINSNIFHLFS